MTDETQPTQEELIQFWKEHQEQERLKTASQQPKPTVGSINEQPPQQKFEALKAEWNRRRGIATGQEETLVMTDEQKQLQKNYLRLKSEFYHRMGREMPETKTKEWEDRLKRDQAKYSR